VRKTYCKNSQLRRQNQLEAPLCVCVFVFLSKTRQEMYVQKKWWHIPKLRRQHQKKKNKAILVTEASKVNLKSAYASQILACTPRSKTGSAKK
jgi:hypothetical protein